MMPPLNRDDYERQVREAVNGDEAKKLMRLVLVVVDMLAAYFESRNLPINIKLSRHTTPGDPKNNIVVNFDWASLRN